MKVNKSKLKKLVMYHYGSVRAFYEEMEISYSSAYNYLKYPQELRIKHAILIASKCKMSVSKLLKEILED